MNQGFGYHPVKYITHCQAKRSNIFVLFLPSIVKHVCFLYVSAYNLKVSQQFFC